MKTQHNFTVCALRNKRVILDFDAAKMFEITNHRLRANIRANLMLFPSDAMIVLTEHEWKRIKCMYGIQFGGRSYRPYAFTQVGLILLAGLIRQSSRAYEISIFAARMFSALRHCQAQIPTVVQKYERDSNLKYLDVYNALSDLGK